MHTSSWRTYANAKAGTMLILGIGAGLPMALIFATLSLWLSEAGIDKKTVTMFGWAALGYSFKFIWAPLVDTLPVPYLHKIGKRKSWLLVAQGLIVAAICFMATINPAYAPMLMALGAVWLGFASATQDIVIDAYRIEIAPVQEQAALSAMYVGGYRIGMLISGAGALFLAEKLGSSKDLYSYSAWQITYFVMAGVMALPILTAFFMREPSVHIEKVQQIGYGRVVATFAVAVAVFIGAFIMLGKMISADGVLLAFLLEVVRFLLAGLGGVGAGFGLAKLGFVPSDLIDRLWISPVRDFFAKYKDQALLLLLLIGFYRVSDIVAGMIANVYYQDLNFSKSQIALAVKTFGVIMTIGGGFLGGLLAQKMPLMRAMMVGALLSSLTNLLFILLFFSPSASVLYMAVSLDNLAAGLASAVFLAFLSALTSVRFTAVQYAIFSSLMTLFSKLLGGYSGAIVQNSSYPAFFTITFLLGLPVLYLIYLVGKRVALDKDHD